MVFKQQPQHRWVNNEQQRQGNHESADNGNGQRLVELSAGANSQNDGR